MPYWMYGKGWLIILVLVGTMTVSVIVYYTKSIRNQVESEIAVRSVETREAQVVAQGRAQEEQLERKLVEQKKIEKARLSNGDKKAIVGAYTRNAIRELFKRP